jgi:hypothetical protein
MHINRKKVTVLINIKAEVFVISSNLIKKLWLSISHTFSVIITDATEMIKRFFNLYEDVSIDIRKIIYKVLIWMIHQLKHDLILKQLYYKIIQLKLWKTCDEEIKAMIYISDDIKIISWIAV